MDCIAHMLFSTKFWYLTVKIKRLQDTNQKHDELVVMAVFGSQLLLIILSQVYFAVVVWFLVAGWLSEFNYVFAYFLITLPSAI